MGLISKGLVMSTDAEVLDYEAVHDEAIPDTTAEPQPEEIGKFVFVPSHFFHLLHIRRGTYSGIQAASFRDFLLKPALLQAITDCGFEHPSEGISICAFFRSSPSFSLSSTTMHPTSHKRRRYFMSG